MLITLTRVHFHIIIHKPKNYHGKSVRTTCMYGTLLKRNLGDLCFSLSVVGARFIPINNERLAQRTHKTLME